MTVCYLATLFSQNGKVPNWNCANSHLGPNPAETLTSNLACSPGMLYYLSEIIRYLAWFIHSNAESQLLDVLTNLVAVNLFPMVEDRFKSSGDGVVNYLKRWIALDLIMAGKAVDPTKIGLANVDFGFSKPYGSGDPRDARPPGGQQSTFWPS